ncbi:MAG TPA: HEAT repeat domain-containing protein, partial [Planctomycetota bacterium]|nr:HEAT repeat domain-containing protein [Planctomycetota bacterium]
NMLSEESAAIRLAAAKALKASKSPDKRPLLLRVWKQDADERVRLAALISAGYPAKDARNDDSLLQAWRELLHGRPDLLRQPAFSRAAGDLRIAQAAVLLLPLTEDPELRYIAIESLGKIRCAEAVGLLLETLARNESWVMNRQVCRSLGQIREPASAPALAQIFRECKPETDRDSWDRMVFVTLAMVKIGGDDIFDAFAAHITDPKKREFALYGLHRMTGAQPVWVEHYWLYTWKGIEQQWRTWWAENKDAVAKRLDQKAKEEYDGEE